MLVLLFKVVGIILALVLRIKCVLLPPLLIFKLPFVFIGISNINVVPNPSPSDFTDILLSCKSTIAFDTIIYTFCKIISRN